MVMVVYLMKMEPVTQRFGINISAKKSKIRYARKKVSEKTKNKMGESAPKRSGGK